MDGTGLVEIKALDPSIRLDIKYARTDNFMGRVLYPRGVALLQRPAAKALMRVNASLRERGLGLVVYDAYRPYSVTCAMWDETPEAQRKFVANPAEGSKHNRGCAVDVTLCDSSSGVVLPMPSEFDEFSDRAYADYGGGSATIGRRCAMPCSGRASLSTRASGGTTTTRRGSDIWCSTCRSLCLSPSLSSQTRMVIWLHASAKRSLTPRSHTSCTPGM